MNSKAGDVTALLAGWSQGESEALARLMPLVFGELRSLAESHLRRERRGHTLQPTALVNEVYMRLAEQRRVDWASRSQFFAFASTLMRRILVDHAKARQAGKRGGGAIRVELDARLAAPGQPDLDLLALDLALSELADMDPELGRLVEWSFFGGLSHEEIAEILGTSSTTVKRRWRVARLWLFRKLEGG